MEWSNETTIQFLELYQGEPCLWDPSHADHKRKDKLCDAWQKLAETTGKSVPELKKKKDSLMATFRGHLRRKRASMQRGAGADAIYKPIWFAYTVMESFLGKLYNCHFTINTEDMSAVDNGNTDYTNEQFEDSSDTHRSTSSQQTVRSRKKQPELREAERHMKDAFALLHNVVANDDQEDECNLYGKLLAKRLRKLPDSERELLMHDIDGMVLTALQRSRSSVSPPRSVYGSPPPISSRGTSMAARGLEKVDLAVES